MPQNMPTIYAARWVLPIISSPIEDGAIAIDGTKILAVGPDAEIASQFPNAKTFGYGQAAILPGFVNAHTHLELTVMRGFLENEESDFFAWLRKLTVARMTMTEDDLRISALSGAIEAASAGITCVGDSSSLASETIKALRELGLRGVVYQESFGPDPRLARENVAKLRDQMSAVRALENKLVRSGISPHAPYTVSGAQLNLISQMAIEERLPVMMHAAESQAEKEFLLKGRGPFAEGFRTRGIEWCAPGTSAIEYLAQHGILETKPLLAHCITVDDADLELIKNSDSGVAHCPKSNAKLGHGRAPFAEFVARGLNVGLGSDSVASNNTCDVLEEARFATLLARLPSNGKLKGELQRASSLTADRALFAATMGGARALGIADQTGALAKGMQADIVIIRLDGAHQQPVHDPVDTLIFSSSGRDVLLTMVAGKEIYRDGRIVGVNDVELRKRLAAVRLKLESTGDS